MKIHTNEPPQLVTEPLWIKKDVSYFLDKIHPKLFQFAYRRIGNDEAAIDVVQEAKLRYLVHQPQMRENNIEAHEKWLFSTVRFLCFDWFRSKHSSELQLLESSKVSDESNFQQFLTEEALREALKQLPKNCQEVVKLVCFKEMTRKEAAASLGIKSATLRSRLFRARRILKDKLDPQQWPELQTRNQPLPSLGETDVQ